uniref:Polycystic kidney disease 1 like 2b n=1 Tax=Cyprinus carpio TaxID=7962 RepID=A0A8C2DZG6_CYPCA
MDGRLFTLLFLIVINIISACCEAVSEGLSCSENQQGFESSCYEFVAQQRSFLSAQAWCERDGGHLAFIQNDETQQFLQKHLQPEQDWWIGLVSTSINLALDTQGGSIWLDGSDVIYSNWLSESMLETGCGYINTDSGFHWKTTSNCSQEFYFICEFEQGRSLSCLDRTILHCGLDQVIEVDESYYGRKTPHYCRSNISSSLTASLEQCSWISVLDVVAELCNGQQFCTAVADVSSFGEPCPSLGSYLLVEYHCKDSESCFILIQLILQRGSKQFLWFVARPRWFSILHQLKTSYKPAIMFQNTVYYIRKSADVLTAFQSDISGFLITAVDSVQSFLLTNKTPDLEPTIITSPNVNIYVNRISPVNLHKEPFSVENSSAGFKLPNLGSDILPVDEPVDVKMTHFNIDPWIEGQTIHSIVTGLSLSKTNGSGIPVANLTKEIEILLPRLDTSVNSSVLDLRNFSTSIINITTPNITLVIKLRPSEDLTLILLLGYETQPTEENNVAKVTLPQQGNSQDERYTWVLGPSDMAVDVGVYNLLIRPVVPPGVKSINASVTITSITAQCIFWQETRANWSDYGCRVGPKTTPNVTQCLCTHLTFFGSSFFVMPNTVDPSKSAELFSNFAQNPVVVCFIGAIFLAYILIAAWARRKDLQDTTKVKITMLEDNDPFAEYCYLLKISTGHRMGSSTSSRVIVTLQGTEGECEPHHLTDPDKPVFERGGVDLFLLTTPFSLGELQSIRLWHDNSGAHPAWYVNMVMVEDLQTEQKWHFLCSSWLAVDIDDCTVEKVFPVASEADMKGFSNLFFMKTTTDFCDGHIWYSVVSRPPSSSFTRVQRVSCCFSVLLCSMLTSIMFYGIPTDPSEQTMDMGPIKLTWSEVRIGIQSSFIVFPVNLVIVGLFRHSRPRKKKTKKEKKHKKSEPPQMEKDIPYESDIQRITYLFANAMRCPVQKNFEKEDINTLLSELQNLIEQQHLIHKNNTSSVFWPYTHHLSKQLENVEGEVKLLGPSDFSRPGCYIQVLLQVQSMKKLLESLRSSRPTEQRICSLSPKKNSSRKGLPWWFVYVGWLLVAATSVVSGYFTMLYGLKYGKDRSISWIISIAMSFTESLFFTQPVKVLCFAIFFALVVKKVNFEDAELIDTLHGLNGVRLSKRDCTRSYYQPPPPSDIEKIKRNMVKQQKAQALIMEILVFLGFLWMLLLVAYGQRDENGFYLTRHIRQSFSNGISESMNHNDVFTWANTVLLNNLFGQYPGFITDGNSKLVGGARFRQVRVKRDSCEIPKSMSHAVPDCSAPYSWENEDMGAYGPGWDELNFVNGSENTITAWQYQSQSALKAIPVWGMTALYRGGGYVMDLGSDLQNASRKLQYLFDSTWLDMYTRAVFAEFTVYNANVNLFCIVTLILEGTAVGAFQFRSVVQSVRLYQSTGGFQSFLMACQVFYFLFIVYYMFLQQKKTIKRNHESTITVDCYVLYFNSSEAIDQLFVRNKLKYFECMDHMSF